MTFRPWLAVQIALLLGVVFAALKPAILFGQSAPDFELDGPPPEWVAEHAPFGMDVTLDGKIWINTNRIGAKDDYAILAKELHKAVTGGSVYPKLWIRGYHLRNSEVSYRESKSLIFIDCTRETIKVERALYYSSSGEVLATRGPFLSEPVVPGSVGESWRDAACPG